MRSEQPTHSQPPGFIRALPWVGLAAATALTMPTEYEFAVALHWYPVVAWLYPVLLDAYSVIAYWAHRQGDIAAVIAIKLAANIGAHLVAAGMIEMNWMVLAAGSGLVVIVGWRLHAMMIHKPPTEFEQPPLPAMPPAQTTPAAVAPAPVVEAAPVAPVASDPAVPDSPAALDGLGAAVAEPVRFPNGIAPTGIHQEVWDEIVPLHRRHPGFSAPDLKERFNLVPSVRTIQRVVKEAKTRDNVLIAV
ncbi:hypothetical protein [Glycomyces sp. NPDC047010]|uniref:hypothetical protein n=1 Tax=Glycomyces sp. NPDC047010 TaxID=3155023 RepID=UPI0033C7C8E3